MDAALRRLERDAAGGDPSASLELSRRYARIGRDVEAYLLHWKAHGPAADRADLGARLAAQQLDAIKALAARPPNGEVAVAGEWIGDRIWTCRWEWLPVGRYLAHTPRLPALGLRCYPRLGHRRLRETVEALETLVAISFFSRSRTEALIEALASARYLGVLNLRGTDFSPGGLERLCTLPSLVSVSMAFQPASLDDDQLALLARCPRLAHVNLCGREGFGRKGIAALAANPSLSVLGLERTQATPGMLRKATSLNPNLAFRLPRKLLTRQLGPAIASEVLRCQGWVNAAETRVRSVARDASRAIVAARTRDAGRRAAVPLLELALRHEPKAGTVEAVASLAAEGIHSLALAAGVAALQDDEALGTRAERVLWQSALLGADLGPAAEQLPPELAEACRLHTPATLARLAGEVDAGLVGPDQRRLVLAIARGLVSETHRKLATKAAKDLGGSGKGTLAFLVRAGCAGDPRALACVAPQLGLGATPNAATLRELAKTADALLRSTESSRAGSAGSDASRSTGSGASRSPGRDAAGSANQGTARSRPPKRRSRRSKTPTPPDPEFDGRLSLRGKLPLRPDADLVREALWLAGHLGHSLPPLAQRVADETRSALEAGPRGSAHAYAVRERAGVATGLPPGVSSLRRHGESDLESSPTDSGARCGACSGRNTICVHYDGFGSNSGGWDEWEWLCQDCWLYTYSEREWG